MKCKVTNKSDSLDYGQFKPLLSSFMNFAVKRFGFKKPPSLFFVSDAENAKMPLGKTAHYDPSSYGVTIFTDSRHPKDILRSLSHELVHHKQNCNGQFDEMDEMGEGYAQNNSHLRSMEEEAYLEGNMCFRDWEDTHKKQLQESSYYSIGDKKMKLFEWKNAELATLIKERFGIPEPTLEEDEEDGVTEEGRVKADALEEDDIQEEDELEEGWQDVPPDPKDKPVSGTYKAPPTIGDEPKKKWKKATSRRNPQVSRIRENEDDKQELDEAKIRKTVREAIKKYMARK